MMQPSHPPPSPPSDTSYSTSSIFEAIKNDDWEGLLKLYATTVYDAVHSAHFENDSRRQYDVSFPGTFREGESFSFAPPVVNGHGCSRPPLPPLATHTHTIVTRPFLFRVRWCCSQKQKRTESITTSRRRFLSGGTAVIPPAFENWICLFAKWSEGSCVMKMTCLTQ